MRLGYLVFLFFLLTSLIVRAGAQGPDGTQYFTHPVDVQVMNNWATNHPSTFGSLPRWIPDTDPCTSGQINATAYLLPWAGVSCGNDDYESDPFYRILRIALPNVGFPGPRKLPGPFPTEVADLPLLEELDLSFNDLTGTIPTFASPNLKSLKLPNNNLTGSLPGFISSCPLSVLMVNDNALSGPVPPMPLTMRTLFLARNQFDGQISDFLTNWTTLTRLNLASNMFSGPVPDLPAESPMLELYLQKNQLSGSLPASLAKPPALFAIDIGNNALTGTIPNLSAAKSLNILRLNCNQLTGPIPETLGAISTLQILNLEVNNLTGTLPSFLESPPIATTGGSILNTLYFNGSCNFFTPPLPAWCSTGTNLTCVPCSAGQRVCGFTFYPITPSGGGHSGDGGDGGSSSGSEPLVAWVSALWRWFSTPIHIG